MNYAGRAAGATMGFIMGDVPGAVAGYKFMQSREKSYPQMAPISHRSYGSTGTVTTGSKRRRGSDGMSINSNSPYNIFNRIPASGGNIYRSPHGAIYRSALRPGASTAGYRGRFVTRRRMGVRKKGVRMSKKYKPRGAGRGRVKRVKKKPLKAQSLMKGFHTTLETYGKLVDPHCGYITHSTYNMIQYTKVIMGALLRALFTKAGYIVDSRQNVLNLLGRENTYDNNNDKFEMVFSYQNTVTAVQTVSYFEIGTEANISDFIFDGAYQWTDMYAYLANYLQGGNDETKPERLSLVRLQRARDNDDVGAAGFHIFRTTMAELNLMQTHVTVFSTSQINVQNRTKADLAVAEDTTGFDADRIDNQPLKGYLYHFKNGEPRLKALPTQGLTGQADFKENYNVIRRDGIKLTRSFDIAYDEMKEPPSGKFFANCTGTDKVLLQPGEIKKSTIFYKTSGLLPNVLLRLAARGFVVYNSETYLTGVPGKCQMLCLEELLRTASSNNLTMQYEREHTAGAFAKEVRKKATFTTSLDTDEYSVTGS